jgi:uncharacterized lipoprotein NlpE involved in copper resistance
MKKSIITMLAIIIAVFSARAQEEKEHKPHDKVRKEKEPAAIKTFDNVNDSLQVQIGNLLADYYKIKDALVATNDEAASQSAKAFRKTLESIDIKKMDAEQNTFFISLKEKLDYDAEHIQGSPNIDHMREHFITFSDNMWSAVKAFNATNGVVVYRDYCPMYNKGANWISSEAAVKNPYYGKQMLTCGKITDTIK